MFQNGLKTIYSRFMGTGHAPHAEEKHNDENKINGNYEVKRQCSGGNSVQKFVVEDSDDEQSGSDKYFGAHRRNTEKLPASPQRNPDIGTLHEHVPKCKL